MCWKKINLAFLGIILGLKGWSQELYLSQQNFKYLFNNFRMAVPTNIPWAGNWWGYKDDGIANKNVIGQVGISPIQRYQTLVGAGTNPENWELQFHSCRQFYPTNAIGSNMTTTQALALCKNTMNLMDAQRCENLKNCHGWWGS